MIPPRQITDQLVAMPHPAFPGVWLTRLSPTGPDRLELALVRLDIGAEAAVHRHSGRADMLLVLSGRGVMWIDGVGEVPMTAGDFICVPPDTDHRPHSITETLHAFNLWAPGSAL